jgi:acetyl-CoA carboxylase beta subunit
MVDQVVHRKDMRPVISNLLHILMKKPAPVAAAA